MTTFSLGRSLPGDMNLLSIISSLSCFHLIRRINTHIRRSRNIITLTILIISHYGISIVFDSGILIHDVICFALFQGSKSGYDLAIISCNYNLGQIIQIRTTQVLVRSSKINIGFQNTISSRRNSQIRYRVWYSCLIFLLYFDIIKILTSILHILFGFLGLP